MGRAAFMLQGSLHSPKYLPSGPFRRGGLALGTTGLELGTEGEVLRRKTDGKDIFKKWILVSREKQKLRLFIISERMWVYEVGLAVGFPPENFG